ncbi:MAG TPA: sigma-70 family RNA polymerase sigma factor [Verrucomicrobiae bacterium]|nr:sigma-70 family RNA polymerase sigma factor [Verrucomicrobiae bacterium]
MARDKPAEPENGSRVAVFDTTHWSLVLQAGENDSPQATEALATLCRAYWYPLYIHVRRLGWGPEDAQDLTQQFFARFLERKYLERADPERGRFRSFLLTSLKHFLADEWEKLRTQKRGGGQRIISWDDYDPEERYRHEPAENLTPDRIYEKRWAGILLENVLNQLGVEYAQAGCDAEFAQFKSFVWGDGNPGTYAEVAARLKVEENALKVAVHRLRNRFREQLRLEVLKTVSSPEELDAELRHLRSLLSS